MRKFLVFCLSTVGMLTILAATAGVGAAGLYYWHGQDGCRVMSNKLQVVTESASGTQVYDLLPGRCVRSPAKVTTPAPRGPTCAEITELKVRLAAALQRIAELEPKPTPDREPAANATPEPGNATPAAPRSDDF